jgi:hypothetical protein
MRVCIRQAFQSPLPLAGEGQGEGAVKWAPPPQILHRSLTPTLSRKREREKKNSRT